MKQTFELFHRLIYLHITYYYDNVTNFSHIFRELEYFQLRIWPLFDVLHITLGSWEGGQGGQGGQLFDEYFTKLNCTGLQGLGWWWWAPVLQGAEKIAAQHKSSLI